jgi:drug/metabolite transporter (DMT)-like permease
MPRAFETVLLSALAMIAFAMNSILTRMALDRALIDAPGFTAVRLATGAVALTALLRWSSGSLRALFGHGARGPLALFFYALPFSYAYLRIGAATGALILFGAVQFTMIVAALWSGERPSAFEWIGLTTAGAGLVVLVAPGVTAPAPVGALLMLVAGVCWGLYSLLGRRSRAPLHDTALAFLRALPAAVLLSALLFGRARLSPAGATLAVASGAVASGLGYVTWYAALRGLTATRAATVQLTVPLLAALGGVLLAGERPDLRYGLATALILGGIGLAIASHATLARRR